MNPKLELACTLSWFNNWSPNQKEEFGKLVVELNRPFGELAATTQSQDLAVEDLMASLGNLSVQQERDCPSVFECQLQIFKKWHGQWQQDDRVAFFNMLRASDPNFFASLDLSNC